MIVNKVGQRSDDWYRLRFGKVTGTRLKSALGSPSVQKTLMYELIAERMAETMITELDTDAISRGRELEPLAKKEVEKKISMKFSEAGMLLDEKINFGMSPDGIYINENGKVTGGIEIKCPNSKKHIEYVIKDTLPREYLHQVMAPFLLSDDIEFWYFASYDDRNYERPLFLKRIERDYFDDLIAQREKLEEFLSMVDKAHQELTF